MTRTVIRHTLSALAALALVSAFAGGPASAQSKSGNGWGEIRLTEINAGGTDVNRLGNRGIDAGAKAKTAKGLATKTPLQRSGSRMIYKNSQIGSALSRW